MTQEALDIVIREAKPSDAESLLQHLKTTATETGFMTMGKEGPRITANEEKKQLARLQASCNNVLLVAVHQEEVIGSASVHADSSPKIEHIGEVGIVIAKEYWGLGLGTLMLEEILDWATNSDIIKRLELTVQARNKKARHLYEKMGFQLEATMQRGVKDEGQYHDVCLMSKLL